MVKNMKTKMTTNSQLLTTKTKKTKNENELSKQLEQEQNHRKGDYMGGYQWGNGKRRMGKQVEGKSSINGRYKLDRGRLRIV